MDPCRLTAPPRRNLNPEQGGGASFHSGSRLSAASALRVQKGRPSLGNFEPVECRTTGSISVRSSPFPGLLSQRKTAAAPVGTAAVFLQSKRIIGLTYSSLVRRRVVCLFPQCDWSGF